MIDVPIQRLSTVDRYIDIRPLVAAALQLAGVASVPRDQVDSVITSLHYSWKLADRRFGYETRIPTPELDRQEALSIAAATSRFREAGKVYREKRKKVGHAKADRAARSFMRKQPTDLTREEYGAEVRVTSPTWDDCVADALINCLEDMLGRPILFKRHGDGFGKSADLAVLEAFFQRAVHGSRERPDTKRYHRVRDIGSASWFASRLRTRARRLKRTTPIVEVVLEQSTAALQDERVD
jgi:hypothetical protein